MASVISLHEMWFGSCARIEPAANMAQNKREAVIGLGGREAKCQDQGAQLGPPRVAASDSQAQGAAVLLSSRNAVEGRKSRKYKCKKVLMRGNCLRALNFSRVRLPSLWVLVQEHL